jgi:hypothetical protein
MNIKNYFNITRDDINKLLLIFNDFITEINKSKHI